MRRKIERRTAEQAVTERKRAVKDERHHRRNGNVARDQRDGFVQAQEMCCGCGRNHLPAPNGRDAEKQSQPHRQRQAQRVMRVVRQKFGDDFSQ